MDRGRLERAIPPSDGCPGPAGGIRAVCADPSDMAVNDQPVVELQIHPVEGKKVGLSAGRDVDERRWLATELRQALGVPAQPPLLPPLAG